jgi:autotransporter-associated beta strand protein
MGINLGANQVFQSDGNLLLSGALGTSNRTLTVTGAGNVVITNTISGNGAISKAGEGTLTLNGTNTYTGGTAVTAGTLTLNGGLNNSSVTVSGGLLNQTATGTIAGTGTTFTLTTGNATLAGNNTYTGSTTISAGTLEIASTGRLGGGSYTGNISNNATFLNSGTNSQTLLGVISGTGALTQNNSASTLTLSGNNTYTGTTTISVGTLEIASAGRLGGGSYAGNIANSGTFLYNGTNNQTLSGVTSGSGVLAKSNSSTLTLTGNNTYTGNTTISAGTLEIGSTGRLGGGSYAGNISNSGTFLYNGTNNQTLSGVISGSGVLAKSNTSTLILTGNNTYTGATTVSAGILNIQHNNALGTAAGGTTVASGSALQLQGDITVTGEALTLDGGGASNTGALRNISGNNTWAGNINSSGATTYIGSDSGLLTLSGNLSNTNTVYAYSFTGNGNILVSGIMSGNGSAAVSKLGTGTLTLSGNNTFSGSVSASVGMVSISSIGNVGVASAAGAGTTINIGGTGTSGTLLYTGSAATSNKTINLATGSSTYSSTITQNGTGLLKFTSDFTATQGGNKSLVLNGSGLGEIAGVIVNNTGNLTSLTKSGTGTWILSGANTYTGNTTINNGTLQFAKSTSLYNANTANWTASSIIVNNGTTLALNVGNSTNGEFTQAQVNTLLSNLTGSNSSTTTGMRSGSTFGFDTTNADGSSFTIGGVVQNGNSNGNQTVGLTKLGTGTLTLTGNNTYTGTTTISAGTLEIASTGRLGGGSYSQNITNNGTFTYSGSNTQTLSGIISGSGALTQNGTGTLTLAGSNTYTGATTISAGNLSISSISALGSTSGVNLANATALIYNGGAATLDRAIWVTAGTGTIRNTGGGLLTLSGGLSKNGTTLTFDTGAFNVTSAISGSSANSDLIVDGATVTLNAANTYNGPTFLIDGGRLTANVTGALPTSTRTAISMDATGTGSSTLVLGASQSVASLTGAASSNVTLGPNTLTIGNTSGNTTYAGLITGSGGLVKDGNSTQVLSGNNTGFTGTTTVNGTGTLQAAAAGAMGNSTVINVNGGSFLVTAENAVNENAAINLNGGRMAVSGTFNETVGALTLSANSTLDFAGFIGTLRFSGVGSWAPSANLAIWNWSGTTHWGTQVNNYATPSRLVFDTSNAALTNNLANISFYSDSGNSFVGNGLVDSSFTGGGNLIIAVPETETYFYALALLAGLVVQYIRRRAKRKPLEGHRPA